MQAREISPYARGSAIRAVRSMPPRRRRQLGRVACSALAVVATAWLGCDRAPRPTDSVVVGAMGGIDSINELVVVNSTAIGSEIRSQLFSQLLREVIHVGDAPPSFEPALAREWSFSADRKQIEFRLRDDVTWSDGHPVTAHDVKFTLEAQSHPDIGFGWPLLGVTISSMEIHDDHHFTLHYDNPVAGDLVDLNDSLILPKHAWEALPFERWRLEPEWFWDHIVVTGPYTVAERVPQVRLDLVANPEYRLSEPPVIDRVQFRFFKSEQAMVSQLRSGDIDFARGIGAASAVALAEDTEDGVDVDEVGVFQMTILIWNTQSPLFDSAKVRRALAQAVDRQAIVETIWYGISKVGSTPILSSTWAHSEDVTPHAFDPAEAAASLREEGWWDRDGDGIIDRDGRPFRFEVMTIVGNDERWNATLMMQSQLKNIGIDLQPRRLEQADMLSRATSGDFDAFILSLHMSTTLDLSWLLHSDPNLGNTNFGKYSNQEVDRLLEAYNEVFEYEEGRDELHAMERILHEEQPVLLLWEPKMLLGRRSELRNVRPTALGSTENLHEWSREPVQP